MEIDEFLGYNLICKMSSLDSKESYYDDREFEVKIEEDKDSETGYITMISAYDEEDEYITYERDTEEVCNKFIFGHWDIVRKEKL